MPTPTYTPLATITLTGTDAEIVFASIPNSYKDLVLVGQFIPSLNPITDSFYVVMNGDTGSNYSYLRMTGTGSATGSYATSGADGTGNAAGVMTAQQGNVIIHLFDYSATNKHKTWLSRSNFGWVSAFAGMWFSNNAVTSFSIKVIGTTFASGSTFSLYGIAG